jgi:hypothetical protein
VGVSLGLDLGLGVGLGLGLGLGVGLGLGLGVGLGLGAGVGLGCSGHLELGTESVLVVAQLLLEGHPVRVELPIRLVRHLVRGRG